MKSIKIYLSSSMALMMLIIALSSCRPEMEELELGATPVATFTATPLADNPNKIVFVKTSTEGFMHAWDFGNGQKADSKVNVDTVEYPKKGEYEASLTVFNQGGSTTTKKKIIIEADKFIPPPPPVGGTNLLKNGEMADASSWTVVKVNATETTTEFKDGVLNFSNGTGSAQTNIVVYQAVEVKANQKYKFSANVTGAGATNSWLELYFGKSLPAEGADYSDGLYTGLNTWDGCGGETFNEDLAIFGCKAGDGKGKGGEITFAEAGTIYVVLKAGSWDGSLGEGGISIDNVQLVESSVTNLVANGEMASSASWTVVKTNTTETSAEFIDGVLKFSNGEGSAQTNIVVYQAVTVKANQKYKFSANVQGSGATNSWLELYFGKTVPAEGADYTEGLYTGLNTWDGCGGTAFDEDLALFGCKAGDGKGKGGEITFTEAGTIYLVLKAGSWDGSLGTSGFVVDNVKLIEVK